MAEEYKYNSKYANSGMAGTGWSTLNTVGWVAALASALGIGIPALNKNGDCKDGRNANCSENTLVSRFELEQSQEIAKLKADRETDNKLLDLYKQTVAENKAIRSEIADVVEKNAAAHQTIYQELVAQREAQLASNAKFDKDIALNAQANFFQNKLNECRYVVAGKVVPADDICPSVMPRYNSWEAPTSGSTTPATNS